MRTYIAGLAAGLALMAWLTPGAALAQAAMKEPGAAPIAEQSSEYRFQLDLQVNQGALNRFLPAGWESAAATSGAAKDCNLRLILIDRVNITGPDNHVLGTGQDVVAYLEAPVRQSAGSGARTGRMILSGLSAQNTATAGTFGTLVKASRAQAARTVTNSGGVTQVSEDWDLRGTDGAQVRLHVKYVRAAANRAVADVAFIDPANPAQSVLAHTEQETDITRNVTITPSDRVKEFSYQVSGGRLAALFDGTQKPLSWDSQPTYRRTITADTNTIPGTDRRQGP